MRSGPPACTCSAFGVARSSQCRDSESGESKESLERHGLLAFWKRDREVDPLRALDRLFRRYLSFYTSSTRRKPRLLNGGGSTGETGIHE